MIQAIIAVSSVVLGTFLFFINKRLKNKTFKIFKKEINGSEFLLKAVAILFFILYVPHLFKMEYMIDYTLYAGRVIHKYTRLPFFITSEVGIYAFLAMKWLIELTMGVIMLFPFTGKISKKPASMYISIFGTISLILSLIFYKDINFSVAGSYEYTSWHSILYIVLTAYMGMVSIERLLTLIFEKEFKENPFKEIGKSALLGIIFAPAFMPLCIPQILFGTETESACDFTVTHRVLIYIMFAFILVSYFALRNLEYDDKRYFLLMLSLSGFIEYFSSNSLADGVTGLPLHLCNTAIMLMFFAYFFKMEGVFYFTYLVNVLGAMFAILLPNMDDALTCNGVIRFWYNHTYAAALPILGVALGVFKKPSFILIGKAIIAFSAYVLLAAFLDGYINNTPGIMDPSDVTDYFFMYSDFFIEKFPWAAPLKTVSVTFEFMGGIVKLFPIYQGAIYVVFVILMFAIWGIYEVFFKIAARHRELLRRKNLERVDRLELLKELNGRPLNSPLHLEGVDMIKINHFSKIYAGTTVKSVDDINLEIHSGEVFGFIGHNGAGKSTTIKSLVGIQSITEGTIEIEGYDISKQPLEAKLNIGYVSDNHAVYEKLTGREYVNYVADLYMVSEEDKKERIEKYAKMFNIDKDLDREIKGYSHGMKQKIMVISTLIHEPKVWVLDEPLTGLDPTSAYQIKKCMREHADKGNIVFFSSHVIEVVEKICDRIAIISGGKIRKVSTMDELNKEGVSLENLYLSYQKRED